MATWLEDIKTALSHLGGKASLKDLYKEIGNLRSSLPDTYQAIIRRTIETNSSDSDLFDGEDLFYAVNGKGGGVWGLRSKIGVSFTREDCELLGKYEESESWNDVPADDKASLVDIRARLKSLAKHAATRYKGDTPVRTFVSHTNPSGRSSNHYWSCVYPECVPNKSFELQIALIVDHRGAELCFCLGAGKSTQQSAESQTANETALTSLRTGLASVPSHLLENVGSKLGPQWRFRRSWRLPMSESDFDSLSDWVAYAASASGPSASVSRYYSPDELQSTSTQIVDDFVDAMNTFQPLLDAAYGEAPDAVDQDHDTIEPEAYTIEDALVGVFLQEDRFSEVLNSLEESKNVILQGPPGVGKTFIARRLAYCLLGAKDQDRIEFTQFHSSYSYEDFVQGWRPTDSGSFFLKDGVFCDFCKQAMKKPHAPFVFLIDEINRGDLGRILGELMMLIERDKRGGQFSVPLTYAKNRQDRFYVPENVHIVGMMNTADRSLAMVDYALRRRFQFFDLRPEFKSTKFRDYLETQGVEVAIINRIISRMEKLNKRIASDLSSLGPGFEIGHSFFCPQTTGSYGEEWYQGIVSREIAPLLREYWFDDPAKASKSIKFVSRTSMDEG